MSEHRSTDEHDAARALARFAEGCSRAIVEELADHSPALGWSEEMRKAAQTILAFKIAEGLSSIATAVAEAVRDSER